MMSPTAQPQSHIGDLPTSAGYEVLVRKLRLLKYEREGACQKDRITCTKFCPGARAQPQTLVESLEAIARAAYVRRANSVQRMFSITTATATPAMSRSSSYASSSDSDSSVESVSSEPMAIEVHFGKPRMEYECLQDEWMEAEKWVNDLVEEEDDY